MGILDGQVALITGAGRGLGAAIALAMAKEGATLSVSSLRLEELSDSVERIRAVDAKVSAFACDVRDRAQFDEQVASTLATHGAVDILVNNAARTDFIPGPLDQVTPEHVRESVEIDTIGSLNGMLACFPYMSKHGGSIINVASPGSTGGVIGMGPYAMSKEAVRGLTKVAAVDWGQYGIRANVICPAARTEGFEEYVATRPAGTEEGILKSIALGRVGDPELDIGRAVVALASPMCGFITGRTIFIDGGRGRFM